MKKIISIVSAAALIATMAAGCSSTEKAPADTATEDTANTENTESTANTDAEGGDTSSEGGDILVIDSPTMQSITDRVDGFLAAIEESGVAFNIVGQQDGQGNQQVSNQKATDMLTANPDVVAIFGGNDPTALGAYTAADAAGLSPMIYGVDGSPDVKALLGSTMMEGTGAQSPMTIGKTIAETAYSWLNGEEVEEFIPIETFLITADNVAEYGTDGWQ